MNKDYMKSGFEEYADELNTNIPNLNRLVFKRRSKPSLNHIYEMKTKNYNDYTTDNYEKLE